MSSYFHDFRISHRRIGYRELEKSGIMKLKFLNQFMESGVYKAGLQFLKP